VSRPGLGLASSQLEASLFRGVPLPPRFERSGPFLESRSRGYVEADVLAHPEHNRWFETKRVGSTVAIRLGDSHRETTPPSLAV